MLCVAHGVCRCAALLVCWLLVYCGAVVVGAVVRQCGLLFWCVLFAVGCCGRLSSSYDGIVCVWMWVLCVAVAVEMCCCLLLFAVSCCCLLTVVVVCCCSLLWFVLCGRRCCLLCVYCMMLIVH